MADTSAIWQHAVQTTDQLSSPSYLLVAKQDPYKKAYLLTEKKSVSVRSLEYTPRNKCGWPFSGQSVQSTRWRKCLFKFHICDTATS